MEDNWKQEAIERDMMTTMKKLGKGKNIIISRFYKIKMRAELYNVLKEFGVNFDDFSKGEKMFDKDKDIFMNC